MADPKSRAMTEKEAYVAFNLTDRVGSVKVGELALRYGSVADAWDAYPAKTARSGGEVDWKGEFAKAKRFGVEMITPVDEAYPKLLLDVPGRPLVLYVKGDVSALSKPSIAIVGTRRLTQYGADQAYKIAHDLAEAGWSVVSGLAVGTDAEAHRGALAAGGTTVGVIGSGLDMFYPEENRSLAREMVKCGGAVVSEFPFGRPPDTQTFPQRNHVVAALSSGVVAVESPVRSGTLITTSIAADLGRTVMAVPGRVDSSASAGCLRLIREGARLVRNAKDVAEEMSELFPKQAKAVGKSASPKNARPDAPPFSIDEALVMKHVTPEGTSVDSIIEKTGLPVAKVNAICMTLRVKGRIRFFPGNRVATPRDA